MDIIYERLISKIKTLSNIVWDGRATKEEVDRWLSNFDAGDEQRQALYLLSQFMYFSNHEMRELLKSLYRDFIKYPIVENIRRENSDTIDKEFIAKELDKKLTDTKILAVGNPSESGSHLLYYFRQENNLPRNLFINTHEIFHLSKGKFGHLQNKDILHYIFMDDFCGGGTQAKLYLNEVVDRIKSENNEVQVDYLVLFGTTDGMDFLKSETNLDRCAAVFDLDESFKSFGENSRHEPSVDMALDWAATRKMAIKYGEKIFSEHPLGYSDCQLLIGFFHNTPNNTLPIIWFDERDGPAWEPIFKRYSKIYGSV